MRTRQQTLAMKKHLASIDRLPPEMLCEVLGKLQVNDLLRCRLVSTRWNRLIQSMRLKSLAIKPKDRGFWRPYASFTFQPLENEPIYVSQNVDLFEAAIFRSLLKNLRSLYFDPPFMNYEANPKIFDHLNELIRLEVLEITQIHIQADGEDELVLPNLKALSIALANEGNLFIDCPRLRKLKINTFLECLDLAHYDSVQELTTDHYTEEISLFINLSHLYIKRLNFQDGLVEWSVPKNVLTILSKLKELHSYKMATRNIVAGILASKAELGRSDFNYYHCGVKIERLSELTKYVDPEDRHQLFKQSNIANFQIVLDNYSKLTEIVPWISRVNYGSLLEFFNGRIETGALFKKFVRIRHLTVNKPVLDRNAFVEFLKKCSLLSELSLINTGLDQEFFDQLSGYRSDLHVLEINEPFELDLEFVFEYDHLNVLKIEQELSYAFAARTFEHFDLGLGIFGLICLGRGRPVKAGFYAQSGLAFLGFDDDEVEMLVFETKASWLKRLRKAFK